MNKHFNVGDKFNYKDKYGSNHECTVIQRNEIENSDDYRIAEIKFKYSTLGNPKEITVPIYISEQRDSYGCEYFVAYEKDGIKYCQIAR